MHSQPASTKEEIERKRTLAQKDGVGDLEEIGEFGLGIAPRQAKPVNKIEISKEELAAQLDKIKTALDERRDGALVIIARCEVKGDFDEKRDRLAAAIELGADAFWFATHEAADVRRLKDALGRPGFGVLAGGRSPQQFADLGASCGVIPSAMAMAAVAGQMDMLRDLKANGVLNAWLDRQPGMAEVRTFLEG